MRETIEANYYNKELKDRYIQEKEEFLSVTSNYIDVQFRKAADTEYELDKDISNWTTYEILEYYKLQNLTSFESLMCLNSIFSQYTQFCLENNLVRDNQNHYLECNKDLLFGCINKAVLDMKMVDRETVLKWVDEIPNPKDQFILLSLFEYGKSKDFRDIVSVKHTDLDEESNTLKLSDRTVTISDKLINIIRDCQTEDVYYSISGKGVKKMPLVDYGYIVKSYPNQNMDLSDFQKGRNIYIACQRMFDYLGVGKWMSPNSLSEAGKLYMIKERAKEKNISPLQYVYSDMVSEVEKQFGCSVVRSVYSKKYNEYLV
jgi:hypothetical protein